MLQIILFDRKRGRTMQTETLLATKCHCGAITVQGTDFSNSMSEETFEREFAGVSVSENIYCHCDHCVNHWGIDLCGCGSGQPVGDCDNGLHECINNIPAQVKFGQKPFIGWRF